ncbi:probable elongation factor 1-delta isoform X1 [Schistocerca nitens]|uniref:probable elongation factor 1-delta isoform X1 n=1 Tax=Schistocerca nitens TaxID=7011 RepID=UPI0021199255|nr:probable elongation factor 1-delta isoform X1 [Schistocerca nitens]
MVVVSGNVLIVKKDMTSPLVHEKIWFEKFRYDEAERQYFEKLSKLRVSNGIQVTVSIPKVGHVLSHSLQNVKPAENELIKEANLINSIVLSNEKLRKGCTNIENTTNSSISGEISIECIGNVSTPHQNKEEKRFKQKETKEKRNKLDKKSRERRILNDAKGSSNTPLKSSLAGEVAKARQHIKNSLECMDGIAALATNVNVELVNRLNSLEKSNTELNSLVKDLQAVIKQLDSRVKVLETNSNKPSQSTTVAPAPTQEKTVDDNDDGVDLFGSDSEEESEEAKKIKEQRLAEYAAKKSKKPALIAKSNIILDVKPWDDETDMKLLEAEVRKISMDGLLWGASKLVPLAYGIHKLQISCVVEDDKVSVDVLQEAIEAIEDYVQSVDIAAFNKV